MQTDSVQPVGYVVAIYRDGEKLVNQIGQEARAYQERSYCDCS